MGESPLSDETVVKFQRAEKYLKGEGWVVENPADDKWQQNMSIHINRIERLKKRLLSPEEKYEEMLLTDIIELSLCNAIYMLPDWKDSPGATAEYYYAKACGKEIIMGNMKYTLNHDYDLVKLGASVRLLRCLRFSPYEITNLEECTQYTRADFLKLRNFGKKTMKELDKLMEENGFEYKKI